MGECIFYIGLTRTDSVTDWLSDFACVVGPDLGKPYTETSTLKVGLTCFPVLMKHGEVRDKCRHERPHAVTSDLYR